MDLKQIKNKIMEIIKELAGFNNLIDNISFHHVPSIGDRGRICCNVNNFHIHIFQRVSGFGMELRPRSVRERRALEKKMNEFNSAKLMRKDGVFYPWPNKITDGKAENLKRLNVLIEIATISNFNDLSSSTKRILVKKI